jgi:DNA-binding transcriptional MerR regulator
MSEIRTFSLEELATLTGFPRRTVRYYIQLGLVDRPDGETRAARYRQRHLTALLEIRKWTDAGVSLEAIRDLLESDKQPRVLPPRTQRRGEVAVWSHLHIAEGVELQIEPGRAGLSPEDVRSFMKACLAAFEGIREGSEKEGKAK